MSRLCIAIILVGTSLMAQLASDGCPKYICNSTSATTDGNCFDKNATDFFGAKCPLAQRCPNILAGTPSKCKTKGYDGISKLPGEIAFNASDCLSGKMENSYCVGSTLGMTCKSHTDCDVGLICIMGESGGDKTCRPAMTEGQLCDHSTHICGSGLYCDNKDFVCEYYGSTKVGAKVGTLGQASECESFFLDLTDKITCINPPKRTSAQLVTLGQKCNFTYTSPSGASSSFIEESSCGMTASGQAWCDPDYQSLDTQRANLIKFVQNNNKTCPCHVYSAFPFCERAKVEMSGFMNAVRAYFELKIHDYDMLYMTVVNVDKCFYDVNPLYYYGGAKEMTGAVLLGMLLLLI